MKAACFLIGALLGLSLVAGCNTRTQTTFHDRSFSREPLPVYAEAGAPATQPADRITQRDIEFKQETSGWHVPNTNIHTSDPGAHVNGSYYPRTYAYHRYYEQPYVPYVPAGTYVPAQVHPQHLPPIAHDPSAYQESLRVRIQEYYDSKNGGVPRVRQRGSVVSVKRSGTIYFDYGNGTSGTQDPLRSQFFPRYRR